ncbi:MAG: hypothetical protein KF708_04045 [Pirellulales bacterium]|nr:hypothetical protein [Pirellulales bacterium]
MSRLFRNHGEYLALGDNWRDRVERAQQKWREQNPPPQPDQRIHDRYFDKNGSLRPRAEREALEAAEAKAQQVVDYEVEQRLAAQPKGPLNWAQKTLEAYEGCSGLSPRRRKELEAKAKEIDKQIDAQLAAEAEQRERESDPRFVEARQHAAEFLRSLPEAFHTEGRVALAILDRIDDPAQVDLYWREASAVRAKANEAKRVEREERQREVDAAAARLEAHFAEMRQHESIVAKEAEHGGATDAQ